MKDTPVVIYKDTMAEEKEREKNLNDDFYKELRHFALDKSLNGDEKLFLTYVSVFNKKGLYAKNDYFRKEQNWDNQKVSKMITKLLREKRIMIQRKTKHSPERWIFLYDEKSINAYKQGVLPTKYSLDYYE